MSRCKRVVVLGPRECGKTALILRFICKRYRDVYDALTIESEYEITGQNTRVLDTAGCDQPTLSPGYSVLRQQAIEVADSFVVVLDASDEESAEKCSVVLDEVELHRRKKTELRPVILVVNKIDQYNVLRADAITSLKEKYESLIRSVFWVSATDSPYEDISRVFSEAIYCATIKIKPVRTLSSSAPILRKGSFLQRSISSKFRRSTETLEAVTAVDAASPPPVPHSSRSLLSATSCRSHRAHTPAPTEAQHAGL